MRRIEMPKLTAFFYLLMRDHLTPGIVTGLVRDCQKITEPVKFTNKELARMSNRLINELINKSPKNK